jgi:hypothetical protein
LANLAWNAGGTEFTIQNDPATAERNNVAAEPSMLKATCSPNPTNGAASLSVQSAKAGKAKIAVFGPFGNRLIARDVDLIEGTQVFDIPEVAQLPAGVYNWKVFTTEHKSVGRLVKQ